MVQLRVLSGKMAGHETVARRFPFQIGRASAADLRLDDPGVWDQHLRLELRRPGGFVLAALGDAILAVNGQPVREAQLRNGDRFGLGSVQVQFWLAETRLRGLRFREAAVWMGVGLVTLGQVALMLWLLR